MIQLFTIQHLVRAEFVVQYDSIQREWKFSDKIDAAKDSLFQASLARINEVGREHVETEIIIGPKSKVYKLLFAPMIHDDISYQCLAIVQKVDKGSLPTKMACTMFLESDLIEIKDLIESMCTLSDLDRGKLNLLTPRENSVVRLISKGLSQKQIADALGISMSTVESHKDRIYRKIGVNSSMELMVKLQKFKIT